MIVRLLLLGTLSATLLGLLVYGGTLIATRRPGDSLHPVDAPDETDETPVVQRPARSFVPLPVIATDTCTPRPGWACWRGRLQLPAGVRATWAERLAARTAGDSNGDVSDQVESEPSALPPEGPFDEFFSLDVSLLDGGTTEEATDDEPVVNLHADGTFEIQAPPGRYDIEATSEDNLLIGGRDDLRAVAGGADDGVDIVLAPAVSLSGRILDDDDVPVGATLSLMRTGENRTTLTEEEDGKIAFGKLRPGRYHLAAETQDGQITEGTYLVPRDDVMLRLPRPRTGLLLFPRPPDGRCPSRRYLLRPHADASRSGVPQRAGTRNVWAHQCQAIVENVPLQSTWDVMAKDLSGPVVAQVYFGSDWPLPPICVEGTCGNDAAVLEPWLMALNGERVHLAVTVTEADGDGAGGMSSSTAEYILGLRANQTVTVQIDLDAGPVTQQVWLHPGVNRAVIRLPIPGDPDAEDFGSRVVN